MVADRVEARLEPRAGAERVPELSGGAADLSHVGEPVADLPREPRTPQREQDLLAEARARIPRDRDVLDVGRAGARLLERGARGERGEARAMLLAIEPLLGDRGDEPAVLHERDRRVRVVCVEAKDPHGPT